MKGPEFDPGFSRERFRQQRADTSMKIADLIACLHPVKTHNYGKESYEIPAAFIEKRRNLLDVAANHGVDLRTAALQFSAAPDVVSALVVSCKSEQQILADYTSMQTKIPAEFWADLKAQNLIEQNAPLSQMAPAGVS
jgi:hypothetical protein